MDRRIVPIHRDVTARLVPSGAPVAIPAGAFVTLTQALGGTYTVVLEGNMARIDGEDADALGFEAERLCFAPPADGKPSMEQVRAALATVHDPEIPVNIVDLGLVYGLTLDGHSVRVEMTLTSAACGMGPVLVEDVKRRVGAVPFVRDVAVALVFEPPWSRDMMTEEAQLALGIF